MPLVCQRILDSVSFHYDVPAVDHRDAIMLQVLNHLDLQAPKPVNSPERRGDWESCWSGNLDNYVRSSYDRSRLVPDFIRPAEVLRLSQDYVLPRSATFELDFFRIQRAYLFYRYFSQCRAVSEFGCGSGFNLVALSDQIPHLSLCGLDWSRASAELVSLAGQTQRLKLDGRVFDFFHPDPSYSLATGTGVLTVCALEQTGSGFGTFLDWLIGQRPAICVHIEPLAELYDESNQSDYLALRYHRKRGYLEGFLTRLRNLESQGILEIVEVNRPYFGSLYHEGYSWVVWRPS